MQKILVVSIGLFALILCSPLFTQAEPINKHGMLVYKHKKSGDQHWTYGIVPQHSFRLVLPSGRELKLKLNDDAVRGKNLSTPTWKAFLRY